MKSAYEYLCPSFSDMNIEQQIEFGICDWCAEGINGHLYFGQSKIEAESIRESFEGSK